MIKDELKSKMLEFFRAGKKLDCTLLRTVIGEIDTVEARTGKANDDTTVKILKRFKQANEETIGLLRDEEEKKRLQRENEILVEFIPAVLSDEEIIVALGPIKTELSEMAVGPAIGRAVGFLKQGGYSVEGGAVAKIVRRMR